MKQRSFNTIAATLFTIVGVLHLLRIIRSWSLTIETYAVPMWISVVGVIVLGILAYQGFKLRK